MFMCYTIGLGGTETIYHSIMQNVNTKNRITKM